MSSLSLVPARVAVVDDNGSHLCFVNESRARELIEEKKVRFHGRNGQVRVLVAKAAHRHEFGQLDGGRGTGLDHKRYSHRHETDTNPHNVWTFYDLPREQAA